MKTRDPFTLEIIKNALDAVSDEMFAAMQRTSMSPIIYETLDYSVGLTDAQGNLITQGNGVTIFLGMIDSQVRHVIEKFGPDNIHEGDMFVSNDVYAGGGTHLSDGALVAPVFFEGERVAFLVNKAHWTDVGGKDPGSTSTTAKEIFQEGLQLPNVKLFDRGTLNQPVLDIIAANSRTSENTLGDIWAGVAANRVGERRLLGLYKKYGRDTVEAAVNELFEYSEAMAVAELGSLPRGVFDAEDYIDDDGLGNGPFKIKVKVTIKNNRFVADYTGSHPQVAGPINHSRTGLVSAVRLIFKALTNPQIPANAGAFRNIEVICPDETIFTIDRPAPVSLYWESLIMAADLVWKALAPHVPERLTAGHLVSVCSTILSYTHPDTGKYSLYVQPLVGGWGAAEDSDGQRGQFSAADGETYNMPVEIMEGRYGLHVEKYGFHTDDGGAGKYRGGNGVELIYRIRAKDTEFTASFGRNKFPPWGVAGGMNGSPNYVEVHRTEGSVERFSFANRLPLKKGDRLRLITATGGGWGDPKSRPDKQVERDLRNGYITLGQAVHYGLKDNLN